MFRFSIYYDIYTGLKHNDEFSDEEKKALVEENSIQLIGPTKLSEKYNTLPIVITSFVREAGFAVTPDDLSKFPDFPRRTVSQTDEEYQVE